MNDDNKSDVHESLELKLIKRPSDNKYAALKTGGWRVIDANTRESKLLPLSAADLAFLGFVPATVREIATIFGVPANAVGTLFAHGQVPTEVAHDAAVAGQADSGKEDAGLLSFVTGGLGSTPEVEKVETNKRRPGFYGETKSSDDGDEEESTDDE